ncbi:hypothetical protein [Gryllotalpicola protaetiae]|uniref:Uncharacterized protein n=1 Tax=Gryllotalpicola protaetiae TaxID=2419771 RepID=A0A387BV19_9MICO|nr:hypothetical protein [Gryllotalpicola protaetiae]AYG02261.1 hypothetical protein D7I44_01090 [Gryllotalpicola protaetiae]
MFFGRRKHAAPAPAAAVRDSAVLAPAAPELTDELIFAAVQKSLDAVFGEAGDWTVARRSPEQDDLIFHEVLVHSLTTAVTASVAAARESLVPASGPLGLLRTPRAEAPAEAEPADTGDDEPAALSWEPAPITRWADLKRPVTGEIAVIDRNKAA